MPKRISRPRMSRPRLLVRSNIGDDRVTYQFRHAGSVKLVHRESRGTVHLLAAELRALCKIFDPLSALEVLSYQIESGEWAVRLQRLRGQRGWCIRRNDGAILDQEGSWLNPQLPGRWPTARAALEFWEAREKP